MHTNKPQVVVIGGGFAGMACARSLKNAGCDIKLIDRRNFHLFQPLLYQVATGGLSPANIAAPLRSIFRRQRNAQVIMANVADFDFANRHVLLDDETTVPFDYLVLAAGSSHHYFGKDAQWEPLAPGLKTIEDATRIRRKVLSAFEQAEIESDPARRAALLTFVIVGGGPTGVEMAGAICELSHLTMKNDFREINPASARIILVENSKVILEKYDISLSKNAKESLVALGCEVWNECKVADIAEDHVMIAKDGVEQRLDTFNVIWAAGVKASELGKKIAAAAQAPELVDRGGRVIVDQQCAVPGFPNIYVVGDMAAFATEDGKTLPGVAPVAMQQGAFVGERIATQLESRAAKTAFRYWDKGNMATIGGSRAVVESGKMKLTGKIAWLAWLFIHIMYLARFENRVLVMFQWFWNYMTRNRSARLITGEIDKHIATKTTAPLLLILFTFLGAVGTNHAQAQNIVQAQKVLSVPAPHVQVHDIHIISWKPPLYHGWPTLTRRSNGELLLAFSGGRESHICPFGRLELMRSSDNGRNWGWPQVLYDSPIDDRDAGIVETPKGTILVTNFTSLAFEAILDRAEVTPIGQPGGFQSQRLLDEWHAARDRLATKERKNELGCYMWRSTDGGVTWSSRYRVPINSPHGPICTHDKRLLYPGKSLWGTNDNQVYESKDDGLSWTKLSEIPTRAGDDPKNYHELTAIETADGKLLCHIRNHNERNKMETLQCESSDGGMTWTEPHSIGVWGLPSHLLRNPKSGDLIMSYGHRRKPFGVQVRVSKDQGKTWSEPATISNDGDGEDLGYPSTVSCDDGSFVTVWYEIVPSLQPLAQLRQARWEFVE